MGTVNKIKIAILCKSTTFESWEADCLRSVLSLENCEVVLLVKEKESVVNQNKFSFKNIYWRFFKRFRLKTGIYDAVSLESEFKNVPVISCLPELKGKYSQHFSSNDIEQIKTHKPDVILRFAFNILRGEILTVAKYGVWSYHHADEQIIRGGPAAFWEIYHNHSATGAILQRLTEKLDSGIILRKGHFLTLKHSYKANLEQLVEGTKDWMKQALIDISNDQSPALNGIPVNSAAPVFYYPGNFQMLRFRIKILSNKLKFHWIGLFQPEQWNIGILEQHPEQLLTNGISNEIKWLPQPKSNEYNADPFGWIEKGKLKIVFEKYFYKKRKGVLFISDNEGNEKELLEAKVHLSYPYVIEREDAEKENRIIIPESHSAGNVFCFDSANPKNGKLLLNVPAVDSTPIKYNEQWWLFCTMEGQFSNSTLHLFHAKEFEGPWLPHSNNPVKIDIRSSRPGGTPFIVDGKLYRPAQDCSTTYGAAIVIHQITELTTTSFKEEFVKRIEPNKNWKFNKGIHTISVAGDKILIDAKRNHFNFDNFNWILKRKFNRIFNK